MMPLWFLENIVRHREMGKSLLSAAIDGAEITFTAMAATLAIVAIFLPVAFMSGLLENTFTNLQSNYGSGFIVSTEALTDSNAMLSILQTRSESLFIKMVDAGMSKLEVYYEFIFKILSFS